MKTNKKELQDQETGAPGGENERPSSSSRNRSLVFLKAA